MGLGAENLVWIVRGTAATEDYVRAVLRKHATTLDPYDQQGMTGEFFDHTPNVPGFTYWDLGRETTIGEIGVTLLGDCIERYYVGYVRPDGAPGAPYDLNDLALALMKPAGHCLDQGIIEEVTTGWHRPGLPGARHGRANRLPKRNGDLRRRRGCCRGDGFSRSSKVCRDGQLHRAVPSSAARLTCA